MCRCIERINSDRSLYQNKSWEFPTVFFKPYLHFGSKQVFKNGRTNCSVLKSCIKYSSIKFCCINIHHPAKIQSINAFYLRRGYHHIIHNGIIQNSFSFTIENDPTFRVNDLWINSIIHCQFPVFIRNNLEIEQLRKYQKKCNRKYNSDDTAS